MCGWPYPSEASIDLFISALLVQPFASPACARTKSPLRKQSVIWSLSTWWHNSGRSTSRISYTYLKYNMYDLHIYIHQMVSYSMYTYICICIHHYIIIYMWHKSRLSVTCFSSFWYVHLWRFFFSLEEDVLPPCLHTQQYMGAGCCWNSMDIPREFRIWSLARRFFESIRQDNIAVWA